MASANVQARGRSWVTVVLAIILAVAGVALFVVGGVLTVRLVQAASDAITTLPAAVVAPTAVASLTVIVSVFSVLLTTQRSRASEIERDHRRQKIPVYEEFYDFLFSVLLADVTGRDRPSDQEMIRTIADFNQKVSLWGGPSLIKTWNEVRTMDTDDANQGQSGLATVFEWERLLFAIREDIGHSNKGLKRGDLLRLFINDLDEYLGDS